MSGRSLGQLRGLLVEGAMITFAVILGFLVTDWGEDRRERLRSAEALERVRAELRMNLAELERALPYWESMGARFDSVLAVEADVSVWELEVPDDWRGLSPPSVRSASWEVARSTRALGQLPFGTVDQAAIAYESLDDLDQVLDEAIASLLQGRLERLSEWRRTFSLLEDVGGGALILTRRSIEGPNDGEETPGG